MVLIKHIGRYVLETLETTGRLVIFLQEQSRIALDLLTFII